MKIAPKPLPSRIWRSQIPKVGATAERSSAIRRVFVDSPHIIKFYNHPALRIRLCLFMSILVILNICGQNIIDDAMEFLNRIKSGNSNKFK